MLKQYKVTQKIILEVNLYVSAKDDDDASDEAFDLWNESVPYGSKLEFLGEETIGFKIEELKDAVN